jgi:hypothetical protein
VIRRLALAVLLAGSALANACGSPDFSYFESITSGPNPGATLILVWLSDSPADDAEAVHVTVERLELIGEAGSLLLSDERRNIDLLTLQNGNRIQLAAEEVPPGNYERLRLTLARADPWAPTIDTAGNRRPLQWSDPQAHVIDVPYVFHAPEDSRTEIQLDFNVRGSVIGGEGDWRLRPVVDAVNPDAVGSVQGRVLDSIGLPVVGATIVARDGAVEVRSTRTAPDGSYHLGLLLPGRYDVSLLGPFGPEQTESDLLIGIGRVVDLDFRR